LSPSKRKFKIDRKYLLNSIKNADFYLKVSKNITYSKYFE